jgi:hypothetical protein
MRLVRDHPSLRGAVSMLLVAVYLVASLGVIPSPRVIMGWFGQLTTERYPCESCGCGCASATECWTHCCCHTEHQRLVWAISNGVLPPPVVEFSDEQWIAAANAVKPGNAHCVMCVERIKGELRAGVATKPIHDPACVCDSSADRGCGKTRCGTAVASEAGGGGSCCAKDQGNEGPTWPGPSISALSCKGLQTLLAVTLPPSPPIRVVDIIPPKPRPVLPKWPRDVPFTSRSLDVPQPPPRA